MSDYFLRVLSLLVASYFALSACQRDEESIKKAQYITNGQKRYETHCKNCHGAKGEGLGKLYPPLTDEKYLRANRSSLPCILRHGLSGEIMVHGVSYDSTMPSNPELTALDIAYILTYITNSFGNRGDLISKEEVEESLQSCANEHCQPRVNRQP